MAVGQGSNESVFSYIALGREQTFGTRDTTTANLEFMSSAMKVSQGKKIIEQIERRRVHSKNIKLGKSIEGNIEGVFFPANTACAWIMQNAFGGAITSATSTGETAGGAAFSHTMNIGNILDQTYSALTINTRKGDSSNGKVFEYVGNRVGEYSLNFELDEPLKFTSSLVGKDFTASGANVESALTSAAYECLNFISGRVSIENSFASLTSSSYWHVQSGSISIGNSLKNGNESRRIGSDTLDVLPPGMATVNLTLGVRFDTTTAIDAMIANTKLSCELEFLGDTMAGSIIPLGLKLQMPDIRVEDAGDPEIGGPDEQLVSEISFQVLHDATSASGYSVRSILSNLIANYN